MSLNDNSFLLFRNDDNIDDMNDTFLSSKKSFFNPVGFENKINDNNCFVSVVFHALFHFTKLKDYLINYQLKQSTPNLIVESVSLLNSYQKINKKKEEGEKDSHKLILNPSKFREELAFEKSEFKTNEKGDPIELLNYLFICFHNFMTNNSIINSNSILNQKCTSKKCLIHELFYIDINEISYCKLCKYKKELKYDSNYFTQLLNVDSILYNVKDVTKFDEINGKIFSYSKIFMTQSSKCDKCKKESIENKFICNSIGKYFIVNLGFDGTISKMEDLCKIYTMIGREFNVKDLYEYKNNLQLYFIGMFLYWGSHYICLFFSPNMQKFIMYDDTSIKNYSTWKELIENLIINKYQPVALIYGEYEENKLKKLSPFNIDEYFYNDILQKAKEKDKNINLLNVHESKVKDNEWICDFCGKINNMNNENCSSCEKVNENIADINEIRYNELKKKDLKTLSKEDQEFLKIVNDKKNRLNNIEKWTCPICKCKTNLVTNLQCSICATIVKSIPKSNNDIQEKDNHNINQKENIEEIKNNYNVQNNNKNDEIGIKKNIELNSIKLNNKNHFVFDNNHQKIKFQPLLKNDENKINNDIIKQEENKINKDINNNNEMKINKDINNNNEMKKNKDIKNNNENQTKDIKINNENQTKDIKNNNENQTKDIKNNNEMKINKDIKINNENQTKDIKNNNEMKTNKDIKINNENQSKDIKNNNEMKINKDIKNNNENQTIKDIKINEDNKDNNLNNDIKKNKENKNEENNKKIQKENTSNKKGKENKPPIDIEKKKTSNEIITIKNDEKEKKNNQKILTKKQSINKTNTGDKNSIKISNNEQKSLQIYDNNNDEINNNNIQNNNNFWICFWCGEINYNIKEKYCSNCKKPNDKKNKKVICYMCKREKINNNRCNVCGIEVQQNCPKCKKALPIKITQCLYCKNNIK